MKKQDLKNGAIVVKRNGEKFLKVDNTLLSLKMDGVFTILDIFKEDLKEIHGNIEQDIIRVYNDVENSVFNACNGGVIDYNYGAPTWERKEVLDSEEKKYLSQVIRPFRNRVIDIQKREYYLSDNQYIIIVLKKKLSNDSIVLPDFKKNTMYKGMELDKKYTLEELEL